MKKNNFVVPSGLHIIIGIFFILLSSCEKLPPVDQGNWQTITCKGEPSGRHENGFTEVDGFFYLFGGRGIKPVDRFDPATSTWTAMKHVPFELHHFQAVTVGDTVVVVGAMTGPYPTELPLENELPVGTAAGGIANYENTLFYFGGESAQASAHSETQCLNLESGTWSFAAPLNRGRHGTAAIKYENQLYIASGSGNRGGGPELTLIEKYTPESEWQSLFNGHNLDGWQVRCLPEDENKNFWTVENGAITCNSMDDQNHSYVWLMSEKEYQDFELRLQFKAFKESPGNSGVQIRSRYDTSPDAPNGGWLDGPQVDIHPPDPFRTGLIYDETREEKRWIYPSLENWEIDTSDVSHTWTFKYGEEGWNDLTIICNGTHIKTILNGDVITDWDGQGVFDNEAHKKHRVGQSGHLALQLHAQDALKIQYKNIKIRKL